MLASINILGGGVPTWVQIILWIAALIVALGTLYNKVFRPGVRLAASAEVMLPLLNDLTNVFRNNPTAFSVLDEIVAQFRTDSGSSLRDVINKISQAADDNAKAAEILKLNLGVAKELSAQDRAQLARLLILIDRLETKVNAGLTAITRIENAAGVVADDLRASHNRADLVPTSAPPGTAADTASQSSP